MTRSWGVICAVVVGACVKIPEFRGDTDTDIDDDAAVDVPSVSCAQAIDLGSPAALDNLESVTVCAWINLSMIDPTSPGATIADKSNDGYGGGWNSYLDYDDNDASMHVGYLAREGVWAYGDSRVATSTWTHACTVWSMGALTVYVDGKVDTIQQAGTVHPLPAHDDSNNNLVLGRQTSSNQYYLLGTLDDFALYNRALSSAEIGAIHACSP